MSLWRIKMSLCNINYTLLVTRLIVVIVLLLTFHAYGLAREFVWYLTKNQLFSELQFFCIEEVYLYKKNNLQKRQKKEINAATKKNI